MGKGGHATLTSPGPELPVRMGLTPLDPCCRRAARAASIPHGKERKGSGRKGWEEGAEHSIMLHSWCPRPKMHPHTLLLLLELQHASQRDSAPSTGAIFLHYGQF